VKKGLILFVLLLCCVNGFAEEKKYSYLFTNDFTYQHNQFANEPDQLYNSSSLFIKWGRWSGGLNLRGYNYYKQSTYYTLPDAEFDFHRKYIQYTTPNLELQAGDFSAMLGRGLVLSILPNEKAFRDRTILGGDFRYHSGKWQIRTLGGSVEDELKEQKWQVGGAEVIREYWKDNRVGVHASYVHDSRSFLEVGDRTTWSVSLNADTLPGGFNYYAEISRLQVQDAFQPDGSGYYANLGWTRKNLNFLVEFKKYNDFNNGLNNPPSADRGDESLDLIDSETLRLYSQYSFFNPDIIAYVSVGRVEEAGMAGPQVYAGVNASEIGERLDFSFNYEIKDTAYPVKITEGHATFRITSVFAAELSARDKRYSEGDFEFQETDWTPQLSWAPWGAVFYQRQYSHRLIRGHHNFNNYGFRFNFRRDSYFEFSTGMLRGGEVCASGQCFYMPPFSGWKVSVFTTVR
jgi:hypothetical protein